MQTAKVGTVGYAPRVSIKPILRPITKRETEKYAVVWDLDDYKLESPGEQMVDMFWQVARPRPGQTIIDIGAGAGAASRILKSRGLAVSAFDLVSNAWLHGDIAVKVGSVWNDLQAHPAFDFAYCCDVMEHLPTELVGLSIDKILASCGFAFFSISFLADNFGAVVEDELHLTVRPFIWWRDLFRELGVLHDARDLVGNGVFYASR